jgi:hypothetical protein
VLEITYTENDAVIILKVEFADIGLLFMSPACFQKSADFTYPNYSMLKTGALF